MPEITLNSPLGPITIKNNDRGITNITYSNSEIITKNVTGQHPLLSQAVRELNEYFESTRKHFDVPLAVEGTSFQLKVWKLLSDIPYGTTVTYGELSRKLGDTKAIRAVGRANGNNPIAIVIPCHRVIGTDGKLVGYAGGVDRKRWLLKHEGALLL